MRHFLFVAFLLASTLVNAGFLKNDFDSALDEIENLANQISEGSRFKRDTDKGVTNLDIRDAILKLLSAIRDGNKKQAAQYEESQTSMQKILTEVLSSDKGGSSSRPGPVGVDRKIDNISTFLLRMNLKLESLERRLQRGGGSSREQDILQTLAQESFDILSILPVYIENTKESVNSLARNLDLKLDGIRELVTDVDPKSGEKRSIAKVLGETESNILKSTGDLRDIVIESGHMAESLFERVNDGYDELTTEIKGLSNLESVMLDTADAVMDTKRKIEFSVQQIVSKVGDLVKFSGGNLDSQLKTQLTDMSKTILTNQTQAMDKMAKKLEKEIGQVWRQIGIMYGQVSKSIGVLQKVKEFTENYVNKTGNNLGQMEGQVEGLSDRIVDVDSNLNYMLGQLSLVVQEFNQVKTGLNDAVSELDDEIKEYIPMDNNGGDRSSISFN